jgi:antitoxin component YwqK of YwqJK toxin-antitoxin module
MQDKRQYNEQGERHGHFEIYYDNGQLHFIGEYHNGKKLVFIKVFMKMVS